MIDSKYTEYIKNALPCLWQGAFCGSVTGAAIFMFRYASKVIENVSKELYLTAKGSLSGCIIAVAAAIVVALVMAYLHRKLPEIKGGGIPRSEGILRGLLPFKWVRTLIGTAIGSFMSFFCGVPVGSEGPAVLIGTCLGGMTSATSKNKYAVDRYAMTGGAGAGFAVATGSPLSAMLFALEEIHKRFTPMLVMTVSVAVLFSTFVNRALCSICGISPHLFDFTLGSDFAFSNTGHLLLLGILIAAAVGIFDRSIALFKRFSRFSRNVISPAVKLSVLFGITAIMGLFFPDGIYSGHDVIENVIHGNDTIMLIVVLLVIRLCMMLLITDCGATGGIFIPTLAIGALFGALSAKLLVYTGLPAELAAETTLLGMCAFLGGTLRAPFTACILFAELTGSFTDFFYVAITVFTVNLITELLAQTPFYDMVLESTVKKQNKGLELSTAYYKMTVSSDGFVCGKTVRDVMWPYFCVVLSVEHMTDYSDRFFNDGEKKLACGDVVKVRVRYTDEEAVLKRLYALIGNKEIERTE